MTADPRNGEYYALLVGIEEYRDENIGDLSYSIDDVSALRECLLRGGMFRAGNVFLMTDSAASEADIPTKLNILRTLQWLTENLRPEDTLFFAFAGHGATDGSINFLIPVDGSAALPRDTSILLARVLEWLDRCPARRQVAILDTCHSEARPRKGTRSTTREAVRGVGGLAEAFQKELNTAAAEGRAILSACSIDEVSYEDPEAGHGVFTRYTLEGLEGAADSDGDGQVTVHELNLYVRERVKRWCRDNRKIPTQTPSTSLSDTAGAIVLTGS